MTEFHGVPSNIELPRGQRHLATCNLPVRSPFSEPLPLAVHHHHNEVDAVEQANYQRLAYQNFQEEKRKKLEMFQAQVRVRLRAMKVREEADKLNRTLQLQESENLLMKSVDPVRKPPLISSPLIAVNHKANKGDKCPNKGEADVFKQCNNYARSKLLGEKTDAPVTVIPCGDESEEEEEEEECEKENKVSLHSSRCVKDTMSTETTRIHRLKESRKAYGMLERERMRERARELEHKSTFHKLRGHVEKRRALAEQQVNQAIIKSKSESPVKQFPIEERIQKSVQRNKKISTQSERLIQRLRGKMVTMSVRPPSLCPCDPDILQTGPDFCATNCNFNHNPKAFALALSSLVNCYQ